MSKRLGYKSICDALRTQIRGGIYPVGQTLPSERALSESWQVERATVRHALAVLAEEGWIEKRPGIGSVVRGSPTEPSVRTVAFIASFSDHPSEDAVLHHHFIGPVYRTFDALCREAGFRTVQLTVPFSEDGTGLRSMLAQCAGVVLTDHVSPAFCRMVREDGLPCVLMSDRIDGFRTVLCDNVGGLRRAVQALYSAGHTAIAYIGGDSKFWNGRSRSDGFRWAMAELGLSPHRAVETGKWSANAGAAAMVRIRAEFPDTTAICTANDLLAAGAIHALREQGQRVPEDCAVIGFTGYLHSGDRTSLPPSSVLIPADSFARELLRALQCEMDAPYRDPAAILVPSQLIERKNSQKKVHSTEAAEPIF